MGVRKRSAYRPKPVINPLTALVPAPADKRERVMARFRSSLETIARGSHPGAVEWRDLADACNLVETLTLHMGRLIPEEVIPSVKAATDSMKQAARRYRESDVMRLDAAGLEALRDVISIYEQCLEGLTQREIEQARAETERRVREIRRSKKPSSEVVEL